MRMLIYVTYCVAAFAATLYLAVKPGGHVAAGYIASAAGGWGYPALFAITAGVILVVLQPQQAASAVRAALAALFAGLAAAGLVLFIAPAPPGHLALTIALSGLALLVAWFGIAALSRRR